MFLHLQTSLQYLNNFHTICGYFLHYHNGAIRIYSFRFPTNFVHIVHYCEFYSFLLIRRSHLLIYVKIFFSHQSNMQFYDLEYKQNYFLSKYILHYHKKIVFLFVIDYNHQQVLNTWLYIEITYSF